MPNIPLEEVVDLFALRDRHLTDVGVADHVRVADHADSRELVGRFVLSHRCSLAG